MTEGMERQAVDRPALTVSPLVKYGLTTMVLATMLMTPGLELVLGADGHFHAFGSSLAWDRWTVGLHLASDLVIGLSYVAISGTLIYLARKAKQEIPFLWTFVAFGVFIVACGMTHFTAAVTLWIPIYWAAAAVKMVTPVASLATAIAVPPLVPQVLTLVRDARATGDHKQELEATNHTLTETVAALQASENRFRSSFEHAAIGKALVGLDGRFLAVNRSLCAILGYAPEELTARTFQDLTFPEDLESDLAQIQQLLTGEIASYQLEKRYVHRDGRLVWVLLSVSLVYDTEGKPQHFISQMQDISAHKQDRERLEHQALHDSLTDLPNRALLRNRVEHAIQVACRHQTSFALLLMDLDRFKEINDPFGHQYGDLLLQAVAQRLRDTMRESDTIARLGGDEFALLLHATDASGAQVVARKLLAVLDRPVRLEGQPFDLGASIGIAIYPRHGETTSTLLRCADIAMYVAKAAHSGSAVYAPEQDQYSPKRLALISDLRHALECHEQLALHFQPKVDLGTHEICGLEALLRREHPQEGWIPPDRFVPLAEHTGLIKPLTTWVLNAALRQCRAWHDQGIDLPVAVNLSVRNLHDPELLGTMRRLLHQWRVEPGWLQVEITESVIMSDPQRAIVVLRHLSELGIAIALDDFGTGYSSLAYLKQLPVDAIKIDKSFVLDLLERHEDRAIVRSIIELGHNLGLVVVAEGVESSAGAATLSALGCDRAQGYFFGRPLPADQLSVLRPAA